ncbi:MAG: tyrosine-type recombinase/integrase [Candidatus Aenigmarchaeota archaeon]|nr:tyrosine-type recombinase/integrase [Candidatus Aenigmarchaeota archaeon]
MLRANWVLDPGKFLSREEVDRLLETARRRAEAALAKGLKVAVRDYFVVDLALSTGLRVAEIANLKCKDIFLNDRMCALLVRNGKGGKKRLVRFNGSFGRHYEEYVLWKQAFGEPAGPGDPLLLSSNTGGHMTTRAIEKAFKRTAARASLPSRYSIHCLRHTYACELYRASGYNLRLVQKQLGHAHIATTQVYADVVEPDMQRALQRLYAPRQGRL